MLLDAIATIDDDVNGALAEGGDGGTAVAKGDLLGQLKISKFREHRDIVAESFWCGTIDAGGLHGRGRVGLQKRGWIIIKSSS